MWKRWPASLGSPRAWLGALAVLLLAAAADELRTYTVMLLTSAPLLIDATRSRTFLETGQRVGVQLTRALRATGDAAGAQHGPSVQLEDEVRLLREAAAPLITALAPEQRAAISSADS